MPSNHINPIIPGFSPDPSIIRICDDFFIVTSSFHVFPGLPIYTSKDLISWRHIGNAIHRPSQLSLAKSTTNIMPPPDNGKSMLATGGLYAPTIRQHNGIVYIICTNIIHVDGQSGGNRTENFIISSPDIRSNEWSDPVYFEFNGIDPSIFIDDDGLTYIHGSYGPGPWTKIHLFQVDLQTGKKLSEEKEVWGGTGGIYPEGPHIYKKDGWYFLVISEGGTHDGHMITAARSKNIWGSYEAFDRNPILTAHGTDEYIQFTGHCDLIQDKYGNWWGVCLGVRWSEGRFVMGRETFLTAGEWPKGGWPSLKQVKMIPIRLDGTKVVQSEVCTPLAADPMVEYVYIRDPDLTKYHFSKDITLTASNGDFLECGDPVTFVGKRQRSLVGTATVSLRNLSVSKDVDLLAGLAYYKDEHRYLRLFYDFATSAVVFEVLNNAQKISRRLEHKNCIVDDILALRVEYTESSHVFSYGLEASPKEWKSFEPVDTLEMTDPDFVGPLVGVFAIAKLPNVRVEFSGLKVD